MTLINKIGYITLIFWGCQISMKIIPKLYRIFFSSNKSIDPSKIGDWAVVTGCSCGIGKAFAEELAKKGFNIILVSVMNSEKFLAQQDLMSKISHNLENVHHVKTKIVNLNISGGLDSYKLIEKEIVGLEIGILVNNFSQNYPHPEYFLDLPHNDKIYMNIINCNIVVTTNMCRIILPQMVLRRKGIIINIASSTAVIPSPLLTVFAATKSYVLKFSKSLNIEYHKYGIIVQCLLPASITNSVKDSQNHWISPTPQQYVESAIKTVGKDEVTAGFFPHAVFLWCIQLINKFSPALVIFIMTSILEVKRNHAIQRYVC